MTRTDDRTYVAGDTYTKQTRTYKTTRPSFEQPKSSSDGRSSPRKRSSPSKPVQTVTPNRRLASQKASVCSATLDDAPSARKLPLRPLNELVQERLRSGTLSQFPDHVPEGHGETNGLHFKRKDTDYLPKFVRPDSRQPGKIDDPAYSDISPLSDFSPSLKLAYDHSPSNTDVSPLETSNSNIFAGYLYSPVQSPTLDADSVPNPYVFTAHKVDSQNKVNTLTTPMTLTSISPPAKPFNSNAHPHVDPYMPPVETKQPAINFAYRSHQEPVMSAATVFPRGFPSPRTSTRNGFAQTGTGAKTSGHAKTSVLLGCWKGMQEFGYELRDFHNSGPLGEGHKFWNGVKAAFNGKPTQMEQHEKAQPPLSEVRTLAPRPSLSSPGHPLVPSSNARGEARETVLNSSKPLPTVPLLTSPPKSRKYAEKKQDTPQIVPKPLRDRDLTHKAVGLGISLSRPNIEESRYATLANNVELQLSRRGVREKENLSSDKVSSYKQETWKANRTITKEGKPKDGWGLPQHRPSTPLDIQLRVDTTVTTVKPGKSFKEQISTKIRRRQSSDASFGCIGAVDMNYAELNRNPYTAMPSPPSSVPPPSSVYSPRTPAPPARHPTTRYGAVFDQDGKHISSRYESGRYGSGPQDETSLVRPDYTRASGFRNSALVDTLQLLRIEDDMDSGVRDTEWYKSEDDIIQSYLMNYAI
jgi:hypothetical protein